LSLLEKHTGKFLVLIAGIIIFAHAVVPHHHHFDSINSHSQNSHCETSNPEKHGDNPETHCHALNIVVSEKPGNLTVAALIVSQPAIDLSITQTKPDLELTRNSLILPIPFGFSPPEQIFLTNHSLRAPPATV